MSEAPPVSGPSRRVRRNRAAWAVGVASLAVIAVGGGMLAAAVTGSGSGGVPPASVTSTPSPPPTPDARPAPSATEAPAPVDTFDRSAHPLDAPDSIWVVVNRLRGIPAEYVPPDLVDVPVAHTWAPLLRQEASAAVVAMFQAAADEAGLFLASNSAYRSYDTQIGLYSPGDPTTAPPGHSEHQTGLAIDIGAESGDCSLNECFADTPEGIWLRENAWRFGFLLRYPPDKVHITGYPSEPWHYRYIGVDLATEMHDTGFTTLEEFFGLPAAPADS